MLQPGQSAAVFRAIKEYQQTVKEMGEELNDNYFSTKGLLQEVERSQASIDAMILNLEETRKQKELQETTLAHKLSTHPFRQPIQVSLADCPLPAISPSEKQAILQQLVSQNCSIEVNVRPLKMYPVFLGNPSGRGCTHTIPSCQLKLLLYHLDKSVESLYFQYQSSRNLHSMAGTKLGSLRVEHSVTRSNHLLMKELMGEHKAYLFLENEFKLILAMCELDLHHLAPATLTTMLKFCVVDAPQEMFTLQAELAIRKVVKSPAIADLLDKMHLKRVVVKDSTRSRSPSPTLHRNMARSLLSVSKSRRITVMNGRPLRVELGRKQSLWEERSGKVVISLTSNTTAPSIEVVQEKQDTYLKILVGLQDDREDGYFECKYGDNEFKVTVKHFKLLCFMSLDKSKLTFKSEEDCKKVNALVQLTESVYIRPNMLLRILESPIEQKVTVHSILYYQIKTDFNPQEFFLYPGELREATSVDKGVNFQFRLDSQWVSRKELRVVMAARSKARLTRPPSQQGKGVEEQKCVQNYIELYTVKYQLMDSPVEVSLALEVDGPGMYTLDLGGVLVRGSQYLVESRNENVLWVLKCRFRVDEESPQQDSLVQVQLVQRVRIREDVTLVLHDLTRKVSGLVRVTLDQKQYWLHH